MFDKTVSIIFLLLCSLFFLVNAAWGKLTVHARADINFELMGFNGLEQVSLVKKNLSTGSKYVVETSYDGLALLIFPGGQSYPVMLGDDECSLEIVTPEKVPVFINCGESEYLYSSLAGESSSKVNYPFVDLLIQGKNLLKSSYSIKNINDLTNQKKLYHEFVGEHYNTLKKSDLLRRLLAQYFMMHEYANYHIEGAPATDIKKKYQNEVLNGVGDWITILAPYLPKHEILNHCVSIYYSRSMVTQASRIIEKFKEFGYCPGEEGKTDIDFADFFFTTGSSSEVYTPGDKKSDAIIAFVSDSCPVSMVKTVSLARKLIEEKKVTVVVVAPLEELSATHLAMGRMVSGSNIYFIKGDKWRKTNLPTRIKLPHFVALGESANYTPK